MDPAKEKILIFVSDPHDLPALWSFVETRNSKQNFLAISLEPSTYEMLREKNIAARSIGDYSTLKRREECQALALKLARQWFRNEKGEDLSSLEEVSLGEVFTRRFFYQFVYALNAYHDVRQIIEQEAPTEIAYVQGTPMPPIWDVHGGNDLYKEFLEVLSESVECKLTVLKKGFSERENRHMSSPSFQETTLMGGVKSFVIGGVDSIKSILHRTIFKKHLNILLPSASDISYLRNPLLTDCLDLRKDMSLIYENSELNCYAHPRLIHCNSKRYRDFTWQKKTLDIQEQLKEMRARLTNNIPSLSLPTLHGLSLERYLYRWIGEFFDAVSEEFSEVWMSWERLLDTEKIQLIIISNFAMSFARLYSVLGQKKNIPVLYCPHGYNFAFRNGKRILIDPENDVATFPVLHSFECTGLKTNFEARTEAGVSSEKLIEVGMFQYQVSFKDREKSRIETRQRLDFPLDREIILYAPDVQWACMERTFRAIFMTPFENLLIYKALIDQFLERKNSLFIIKTRPNDILIPLVEKYMREKGASNILIMDRYLKELMTAANALVVVNSNVGYEGLYYQIPVIVLKIPNRINTLSLEEENGALACQAKEIPSLLDRLRGDSEFLKNHLEAQESFLKSNQSYGTGESRRLAQIILSLADNKNS
jgi:hypothetical protein